MNGIGEAAEQLGHPEPGPVGGDGHVAVQGDVEPAGVAQPVDAGHPELAAPLDVAEREVVGAVPLAVEVVGRGAPGEVAAGAEPLVGAGEAHGVERRLRGRPRWRPA